MQHVLRNATVLPQKRHTKTTVEKDVRFGIQVREVNTMDHYSTNNTPSTLFDVYVFIKLPTYR